MKKNWIQFQHGQSLFSFFKLFGTNEQCEQALFEARWPDGFRCPECGSQEYCLLRERGLYRCNRCHRQTSVSAGTIFEATKLDATISLALIEKQVETMRVVALHLHRNGLSVYIREGVDGGLRRFVDTTD